jgi:hypothetical protein
MNSQASVSRADLEFAEVILRGMLEEEEFREEAKADAGSLDRMLVHLVNMNGVIGSSPDQHPNAAKRLGDFAATTARMADRHPDVASKLHKLSGALRIAGERLGESVASGANAEPAAQTTAETP